MHFLRILVLLQLSTLSCLGPSEDDKDTTKLHAKVIKQLYHLSDNTLLG